MKGGDSMPEENPSPRQLEELGIHRVGPGLFRVDGFKYGQRYSSTNVGKAVEGDPSIFATPPRKPSSSILSKFLRPWQRRK